jgi:hypothetical protein
MSKISVNFTKRPMVVLGQRRTVVYVDSAHFALKNCKPVEERTHKLISWFVARNGLGI